MMRLTVKRLRHLVGSTLVEAKKEKGPQGRVFYCPLHSVPLQPKWGKAVSAPLVGPGTPSDEEEGGPGRARVSRGGQYNVDVPEFMRPALGQTVSSASATVRPNIIPPSAAAPELMHKKRHKDRPSVDWLVCPFVFEAWTESSKTGPYGRDADPRECDFRVTARKLKPGQTHPNVAVGEVAGEFNLSGRRPPSRDADVPRALADMVEKMKRERFRWQRSERAQFEEQPVLDPTTGEPTQHTTRNKVSDDKWSKVDLPPGTPKFTQEDIIFLSYHFPKLLGQQKKRWGSDYKGPEPYFLGAKGEAGPQAFRYLLKLGWEPDDSAEAGHEELASVSAASEEHAASEKERRTAEAEADAALSAKFGAKRVERSEGQTKHQLSQRRQRLKDKLAKLGVGPEDADRMLDQSESAGDVDVQRLKELIKKHRAGGLPKYTKD